MSREEKPTMKVFITMFEGLGARDYNLPEVLAELIDNSLANDAKDIKITLNDKGFGIFDDGNGRDFQGVTNALNFGMLTTDPSSLSTYGLGIKQIWSWAGDKVIIVSKKAGELAVHYVTLSYNEMKMKYTYITDVAVDTKDLTSYLIDNEEVCNPENHFWQLQILDLKNRTLEITKQTMERLAQMFSPYIRRGIKISVNGVLVKTIPLPKFVFQENFSEPSLGIIGNWGIVIKGGKDGGSKYYGADTYCIDRMITHADKDILGIGDGTGCKISEHPSYYRLRAIVFFSSTSILQRVSNKNNWIKDTNYTAVQTWLYENITRRYKIELEKIQSQEAKAKQMAINNAIAKTANEFLKDAFPEMKRPHKEYVRVKNKTDETEQIKCDVRTQGEIINPSEPTTETDEGIHQEAKDPHRATRPHVPIFIGDEPYELKIENTLALPVNGNRYEYSKDNVKKVITILINENCKSINVLVADQRIPLYLEWIVEVIIRIMTPALSNKDFLEERERRISSLNADKWYLAIEDCIV